MGSAADASVGLLSELQSAYEFSGKTYGKFSKHLHDFSTLPKPNKLSKSSENFTAIRALCRFLPFLNKALSLLPKRLSETSKISKESATHLLDIYRLCLNCLDLISSQLEGKPYIVEIQKGRFIRCLGVWKRYQEAECEALSVLESLRVKMSKSKSAVSKRRELLPPLNGASVDQEYAVLVMEAVLTLVKCASVKQSREIADYDRVLDLVNEASSWIKALEASACEKIHHMLLKYLREIALFLAMDAAHFGGHLVCKFCKQIFDLYKGSSLRDDIWEFAHSMCSSLFMQQALDIVDVLKYILETMSAESKVGKENTIIKFLKLVCYSAKKCRIATSVSNAVAMYFEELALNHRRQLDKPVDMNQGMSTAGLIIGIYATGLFISQFTTNSTIQGNTKDGSGFRLLLSQKDIIQKLEALLNLLKCHFGIGDKQSLYSQKQILYLPSYFDAMKFLCHPLARFIISEKKEVFIETEGLAVVQDALSQYCHLLCQCQSAPDSKQDVCDDNNRSILVAVAAFTLSFRTKHNIQKCAKFIEYLIESDTQLYGPKYLFTSLYNLAVVLFNSKQTREALEALKLCSKASWAHVLRSCEMFPHRSDEFQSELSEDAVMGFINDACAKIAKLLDVLYPSCSSNEADEILTDCLKSWSVTKTLFGTLPNPIYTVKQFVKIRLKLSKDVDMEEGATLLHPILSSSEEFKGTVGVLMEEELRAYKDLNVVNPSLCQKMRLKIITILLEKVYTTEDDYLPKSRILIAKCEELRAKGLCCECIPCLSEAISTLEKYFAAKERGGEKLSCMDPACHVVAYAYCIRSLCTIEIEPNSKLPYEDIRAALRVWMRPHHCHSSGQCNMLSGAMLNMLYQIIDLLSIKGNLDLHAEIFEMMIQLFKWKDITLETLLSLLWKHRRLCHALCALPINEFSVQALSKHFGEVTDSFEYWTNYLKESQPLLVGFQQSFHMIFALSSQRPCNHKAFLPPDISDDKVKLTASDLISNVPLSSVSAFLSAYLYYDLSERLILSGQLTEALSYAKEAYRLRHALLNRNFLCHTEQQIENCRLVSFKICDSVATESWFCGDVSSDFESCNLTPWNVLQCYLGSMLQVGTINEMLGNGNVAKHLLQLGKDISCTQSLPLFIVSFSCILGQIYCKEQLWELAEKEAHEAKKALVDNSIVVSCKCRALYEVSIDQLFGDIYRKQFCRNPENSSSQELVCAKEKYKSAVDKLALSEWNCFSGGPNAVGSEHAKRESCSLSYSVTDHMVLKEVPSRNRKHENAVETIMARKTKEDSQPGIRMTRSRYRSSQRKCETAGEQTDTAADLNRTCYRLKCWHHLPNEAIQSGCMSHFIYLKWELVQRQLLQRMLVRLGKCLCICNENHEAHKIFLQSVSLVTRDPSCPQYSSLPFVSLIDQIGKDSWAKLLAIDHVELLYNICWSALKSSHCKATRKFCCKNCDFSSIKISKIVSWLKLAFIQSREIPFHFQKVSRLLAAVYVLSTSVKIFALPSSKVISESHWASFFHQASIGAHFNLQLFSTLMKHQNGLNLLDSEGSKEIGQGKCSTLRLAPGAVDNLEDFVLQYFKSLPSSTVVCISFIIGALASLLSQLLSCPSPIQAWILLSRMSSVNRPVVVIIPVHSILTEVSDFEELCSSFSFQANDFTKQWRCPWASGVIDDVAPIFRDILEKNHLSSSHCAIEDTPESRSLWWKRRRQLDQCLAKFLQDLEDFWLGPWRYLLLGELSECELQDSLLMNLADHMKLMNKEDVDMGLLNIVLGGANYAAKKGDGNLQLVLTNGSCIGGHGGYMPQPLSNSCTDSDTSYEPVHKIILDFADKLEDSGCINRKPTILVLDFNLQMLPWESLPILRDQEVYRMPSVGAINATLFRRGLNQEPVEKGAPLNAIPLIDPLDSYYVLNPSGDLSRTQAEFENWFKDQNFEGKSGTAPTIEELTGALKSHDLFLYFGHGSGGQYIPGQDIKELESCAASLLMGCSSGSLTSNGCYIPQGAPLYYLSAGSPIIVANLWEVTDKDIDRFGKKMLDAWFRERSGASAGCDQCSTVSEQFRSLNITEGGGKRKEKSQKDRGMYTFTEHCRHRPRAGSFMGEARKACFLRYLIGAAPVCYGVPTGITRKLD